MNTPMIYQFDASFADDFVFNNNRLVFAQWKHLNSDNRPIVSLRYVNGKLITAIINDRNVILLPHEVDLRNRWSSVTVKLNLAHENGYVITLLDGKEIANFYGATALKNEEPTSFF